MTSHPVNSKHAPAPFRKTSEGHIPLLSLRSWYPHPHAKDFRTETQKNNPAAAEEALHVHALQTTALIVKQNQELVQYTKKLKVQLAKSFHSIQRVKDLEKENQTLKQENQNLKKENSRLKNYIKRAFEAVKVLFDFPIDRFKRLVDGFMEELKK